MIALFTRVSGEPGPGQIDTAAGGGIRTLGTAKPRTVSRPRRYAAPISAAGEFVPNANP